MCKTTIIDRDAFLIEIEVQGEVFQVLWGVISLDETGRWLPGDYVCTTPIQKTEDLGDGITRFVTRSGRTYETTCPVQPYKAKSVTEFRFFMAGRSPAEFK
jgi:hypothetical protein